MLGSNIVPLSYSHNTGVNGPEEFKLIVQQMIATLGHVHGLRHHRTSASHVQPKLRTEIGLDDDGHVGTPVRLRRHRRAIVRQRQPRPRKLVP